MAKMLNGKGDYVFSANQNNLEINGYVNNWFNIELGSHDSFRGMDTIREDVKYTFRITNVSDVMLYIAIPNSADISSKSIVNLKAGRYIIITLVRNGLYRTWEISNEMSKYVHSTPITSWDKVITLIGEKVSGTTLPNIKQYGLPSWNLIKESRLELNNIKLLVVDDIYMYILLSNSLAIYNKSTWQLVTTITPKHGANNIYCLYIHIVGDYVYLVGYQQNANPNTILVYSISKSDWTITQIDGGYGGINGITNIWSSSPASYSLYTQSISSFLFQGRLYISWFESQYNPSTSKSTCYMRMAGSGVLNGLAPSWNALQYSLSSSTSTSQNHVAASGYYNNSFYVLRTTYRDPGYIDYNFDRYDDVDMLGIPDIINKVPTYRKSTSSEGFTDGSQMVFGENYILIYHKSYKTIMFDYNLNQINIELPKCSDILQDDDYFYLATPDKNVNQNGFAVMRKSDLTFVSGIPQFPTINTTGYITAISIEESANQ